MLDVRTRALQSIVFKLNNHLLSPSELVHEKAFLAGLLEWFNFEEWVLESQVLGLVEQLAEVIMVVTCSFSLIATCFFPFSMTQQP